MNLPLVSVIIPNYCHARFLDQRIRSVIEQTYRNFELIILDDCSQDEDASREIIEKYRENSHIAGIVYNEINSGNTFLQWQKGFELAKGELIWIAESDDYCDRNFLEDAVNQYLKEEDVSVVFCTSQLVDENGGLLPPIYPHTSTVYVYEGLDFIRKRMLFCNPINNASSAVFTKRKICEIGNDYVNYIAAGDYLFWAKLAEIGKVIYLEAPKNYFRQHNNKVSPKKLRDGTVTREVYQIIQYLKSKGYISKLQDLLISFKYIVQTKNLEFDTEGLRAELMSLWNHNGKIPYWLAHRTLGLLAMLGRHI